MKKTNDFKFIIKQSYRYLMGRTKILDMLILITIPHRVLLRDLAYTKNTRIGLSKFNRNTRKVLETNRGKQR